jgi:hypothetical protein
MRRALVDLEAGGLIESARVFSLLHAVRGGTPTKAAVADLHTCVADYRPDLVLMQHLGGSGITRASMRALRATRPFSLIYHEGDPFAPPFHPLPREARAIGRAADVVFASGATTFVRNFERVGAREVRYLEWGFDPDRFPHPGAPREEEREVDVVVIANRNAPRLRGLPNWRDRIRFVELVQAEFGERCAIYGRGWNGPGARGVVPFDQQQGAVRSAWISANWDHFAAEAKYHSDRLAISLAAGTVHATTWHPGFDEIFPDSVRASMLFAGDPEALVEAITRHLETTPHRDRLRAMRVAQDHAWAHLRYDDQLVTMLNAGGAAIDPAAASALWSVGSGEPRE